MKPPQHDIDWALSIERSVTDKERSAYLEWMNNKPMSQRTTDVELRDGCILSRAFVRHHREAT